MKKFAIALDPWKFPIFKKHLEAAGFTFEKAEDPIMTVLSVQTDKVAELAKVVQDAQNEARRSKAH